MKLSEKANMNTTIKPSLLFILLIAVLMVAVSFGQTSKLSDLTGNKYALRNLETGIQSENRSVRKSAIYLAGKYKIAEAANILIAQLKEEPESEIRILIGLTLYQINSEEGMKEIQKLISSDENARVRRMSYAIYQSYLDEINNTGIAVSPDPDEEETIINFGFPPDGTEGKVLPGNNYIAEMISARILK